MSYGRRLRSLLAGLAFALFVASAGLPSSLGAQLGWSGTAAAQGIDVDYFYDELGPYGEWVWHPRFGYVWLPTHVSENWRPYTVGHWVYTDEYGWYWDSYEPFAWAVYHYGRWGYDWDFGWFWVPGDTWAPAWVQWRYGDNYVGWAPIGPHRGGYAYGQPLSYDPPVAEAWVFVAPRYLTSRTIYRYALPPSDLGPAFYGAPNIYRPEFRNGVIFNFGFPRDRAARFGGGPIIGKKIYRMDRKGGRYGKFEGGEDGIRVFAPGFQKGVRPNRPPKNFVNSPSDFKPKAKLRRTFEGKPPKGWGPGAAEVESIDKEAGPHGFKPKQGGPGRDKDRGNEAQGGPNGGQGGQGSQSDKDKWKRKGFGQGGQGGQGGAGGQNGGQGGPAFEKDQNGDQGGGQGGSGNGGDRNKGKNKNNDKDKKKNKDQNQSGGEGSGAPQQDDQRGGPPPGFNGGNQGGPAGGNNGNGNGNGPDNNRKRKGFGPGPGFQKSQGGDQGGGQGGGQGGNGDGNGDKGKNKDKNKKNKNDKCRDNPNQQGCQQQSN
jgi:hypothetical protein